MTTQDRLAQAGLLYERAVFGGDPDALPAADRELDACEADLALARGRIAHARYLEKQTADPAELALFERALELYRALGDIRGQAESLFWLGCYHQVVRDDAAAALPALEESRQLAATAADKLTLSYALRHLGFAAQTSGNPSAARELLTESAQLRREIGFMPGVAANLVGLAYLAGAAGRRDEALDLVEEAAAIAEASDAQGIMRWVEEARAHLASADQLASGE